ncbi:MAG: putative membrane protein [Paraglaciecola sp.]|jgi:uncharacterized membrane protein
MLKRSLHKLASNPQKSWAKFKIGLGFFVSGVILIFSSQHLWLWLQIPALLCLSLGVGFAIVGYGGILAYRLTNAFKLPNGRGGKEK